MDYIHGLHALCRWITDVVDEEKAAKMKTKRKNLVQELLETERSYVAQLVAVEQVYIAGLRQDKSMFLSLASCSFMIT